MTRLLVALAVVALAALLRRRATPEPIPSVQYTRGMEPIDWRDYDTLTGANL